MTKKPTNKQIKEMLHKCFTTMIDSVREKRESDFIRLHQLFGDKFKTEGMDEYRRHQELIDENFSKISDNNLDGKKENDN